MHVCLCRHTLALLRLRNKNEICEWPMMLPLRGKLRQHVDSSTVAAKTYADNFER